MITINDVKKTLPNKLTEDAPWRIKQLELFVNTLLLDETGDQQSDKVLSDEQLFSLVVIIVSEKPSRPKYDKPIYWLKQNFCYRFFDCAEILAGHNLLNYKNFQLLLNAYQADKLKKASIAINQLADSSMLDEQHYQTVFTDIMQMQSNLKKVLAQLKPCLFSEKLIQSNAQVNFEINNGNNKRYLKN